MEHRRRRLTWVHEESKRYRLLLKPLPALLRRYPEKRRIYVVLDNTAIHRPRRSSAIWTSWRGEFTRGFCRPFGRMRTRWSGSGRLTTLRYLYHATMPFLSGCSAAPECISRVVRAACATPSLPTMDLETFRSTLQHTSGRCVTCVESGLDPPLRPGPAPSERTSAVPS